MAATRYLTRSLFTATKQSFLTTITTRSYTSHHFYLRLRPLTCLTRAFYPFLSSTRCLSTRQTSSSLNDPNPNWSNRPPKETILLDGCDFEHWLVVMEKPEGDPTREEIIGSYIKTLASVVGSEDEARMKIYSVSTRHYFAFGALVSEELSYKLKELPNVRWVLPDSYLDVKNKDYGGEPFINGEAVPYDPKYHEEWVRNNARANERNRRNDRPRNFDRSRNFERRRETSMNNQIPGPNSGPMQPNMPPQQQPNMPPQHQLNMPPRQQPNMSTQQQPNMPPQQPNMQQQQSNYVRGAPPTNPGNYNNMGHNNPQNHHYANAPNYQPGPSPNQNFNSNLGSGYGPNTGTGQGQNPNSFSQNPGYVVQNQGGYAPNTGPPPGQNHGGGYAPNMGPSQNSYAPNTGAVNPYQNENVPGRDVPQPPTTRY